jgi:hypothetical protein
MSKCIHLDDIEDIFINISCGNLTLSRHNLVPWVYDNVAFVYTEVDGHRAYCIESSCNLRILCGPYKNMIELHKELAKITPKLLKEVENG